MSTLAAHRPHSLAAADFRHHPVRRRPGLFGAGLEAESNDFQGLGHENLKMPVSAPYRMAGDRNPSG